MGAYFTAQPLCYESRGPTSLYAFHCKFANLTLCMWETAPWVCTSNTCLHRAVHEHVHRSAATQTSVLDLASTAHTPQKNHDVEHGVRSQWHPRGWADRSAHRLMYPVLPACRGWQTVCGCPYSRSPTQQDSTQVTSELSCDPTTTQRLQLAAGGDSRSRAVVSTYPQPVAGDHLYRDPTQTLCWLG